MGPESGQDKPSSAQELSDLVRKLCEEQDGSKCESIADQLLDFSQSLLQRTGETPAEPAEQTQLWNCAVSLWNIAVAKSTGGNIHQQLNAKLRHLACNLAFTASPTRTNFASTKRLIEMATKTGRTWLDCNNPSMADQSLELALEGLSKIKTLVENLGDTMVGEGSAFRQQTRDLTKEEFKIYCCKSEALTRQDQWEEASLWIEKAKPLLTKIPTEGPYLAMLCYNIACEAMQKEKYESAVAWLRESLEIGKGRHQVEAKLQARSLRLLATAYIQWDPVQYCQQALNSVGLANTEHNHPFGIHLKIKILMYSESGDTKLQSAVDELTEHPDLSVDIASETVRLLVQHDKLDIACQTCHQLTRRFSMTKDVGKLYVLHLDLLIRNKRTQQAKVLLEDCAAGLIALDVDSRRQIHTMLWEQAAKTFENNDSAEALIWYNFSLNLFTSEDNGDITDAENYAKLQRNRASCFLNLDQLEKAEEAAQEAEKHDPDSALTQYMCFKVAMHRKHDERAIECIEKLCQVTKDTTTSKVMNEEEILSLICLAAQLAMKVNENMCV
ncbi:testis-expressed protein 11-like [Amphiura filiformis]|uniref:testis-expressed protein 11-like n=1 Tax=Amphiura filiformis TaxID=82378 RepID=UPI003B211B83